MVPRLPLFFSDHKGTHSSQTSPCYPLLAMERPPHVRNLRVAVLGMTKYNSMFRKDRKCPTGHQDGIKGYGMYPPLRRKSETGTKCIHKNGFQMSHSRKPRMMAPVTGVQQGMFYTCLEKVTRLQAGVPRLPIGGDKITPICYTSLLYMKNSIRDHNMNSCPILLVYRGFSHTISFNI